MDQSPQEVRLLAGLVVPGAANRSAGFLELEGAPVQDDAAAALLEEEDVDREQGAVPDQLHVADPSPAEILVDDARDDGPRAAPGKIQRHEQRYRDRPGPVPFPDVPNERRCRVAEHRHAPAREKPRYHQCGEVPRHGLWDDEADEDHIRGQKRWPHSVIFHQGEDDEAGKSAAQRPARDGPVAVRELCVADVEFLVDGGMSHCDHRAVKNSREGGENADGRDGPFLARGPVVGILWVDRVVPVDRG